MASELGPFVLAFAAGVVCAGVGGELFVRGVAGVTTRLRVPAALVGVTLAAFATSAPELSVAVQASLAGQPAIALGDALGSNIVNLGLVLGLTLVIAGTTVPRRTISRDYSLALGSPLLIGGLLIDGHLGRADGLLLIGVFVAWIAFVTADALRHRRESEPDGMNGRSAWIAVGFGLAGVIVLVIAGRLIVGGAGGIAVALGMPEFVVGAVVVAIGTSTPELATSLIAKIRGHHDLSLGNVLGSNIFNCMLIVGVVAAISGITVPMTEVLLALGFGLGTTLLCFPRGAGYLGRGRGVLLVLAYVVYVALSLSRPGGH